MYLLLKKTIPYLVIMDKMPDIKGMVREIITGMDVIKTFVREDYESKKFKETNDKYKEGRDSIRRYILFLNPLMTLHSSIMIVSILFMLMDHKRISNLAFIAVLLLLIIYKLLKTDKNRSVFIKILKYAFVFSALIWIYLMSIDFLSETLKLTDRFTSLRMTLWGSAKPYYSFSISYIGKGIGWVKNWMNHVDIFQLENLHNDFLAAYIELGFAGYVLWLLSFVFIFSSLKKHTDAKKLHIGFLFFIYLFLNMLTDNTYIYISFMMPFYLIIFSLFFGEDSDSYTTYLL